jgi:hypothetical protein
VKIVEDFEVLTVNEVVRKNGLVALVTSRTDNTDVTHRSKLLYSFRGPSFACQAGVIVDSVKVVGAVGHCSEGHKIEDRPWLGKWIIERH